MKSILKIAVAGCALLALSGCIAGSPEAQHAVGQGALMQFVLGLWHGFIAPFTLIGEIINHFAPKLLPWTLHLYEGRNTGIAYDIGFYLGLVGSPVLVLLRSYRRPRV